MRSEQMLSAEGCVLLVVDVQEAFAGAIHEIERVVERSRVMIEAAKLLGLPIVATEQYPKGLGRTVEVLQGAMGEEQRYFEKLTFSCCGEEAVREAIVGTGRREVLLVGIEAHVCVAQTALDLQAMGLRPFVAVDAVSSRRQSDAEVALERLARAGVALTTTEAAIMEMTVWSKHEAFKGISRLIR